MNANATQCTRSCGPLRASSLAEMCMCTCGLLRSGCYSEKCGRRYRSIDYTVVIRMNRAFINTWRANQRLVPTGQIDILRIDDQRTWQRL